MRPLKTLQRLSLLLLAAGFLVGLANAAPPTSRDPAPTATAPTEGVDPAAPDPPLFGDNQNGGQFRHFGRVSVPLRDLPAGFATWSDGAMRRHCRSLLVAGGHPMPATYTNHELVERVGRCWVLAVYKVNKNLHSSSGRPRTFHPPDPRFPGTRRYWGGIAQVKYYWANNRGRFGVRATRIRSLPPVTVSVDAMSVSLDATTVDATTVDATTVDATTDGSVDAMTGRVDAMTGGVDAMTDGNVDAMTDGSVDATTDGSVDADVPDAEVIDADIIDAESMTCSECDCCESDDPAVCDPYCGE